MSLQEPAPPFYCRGGDGRRVRAGFADAGAHVDLASWHGRLTWICLPLDQLMVCLASSSKLVETTEAQAYAWKDK
jgi:hypothetical protein